MTTEKHLHALELDKILDLLAGKATSEASALRIKALRPLTSYDDVADAVQRTADINSLSIRFGTPSLGGIHDCTSAINRAAIGSRLSIPELIRIGRVLKTIRSIKDWRENADTVTAADDLFEVLYPAKSLEQTLDNAITSEDELSDNASAALGDIRRKMRRVQAKIREQLDSIIRSPQYAKVLQENIITLRDGRFVVPVKTECKNELKGLIHGASSSGSTVFIEPMAVVDANNEIRMLETEEQQEIDRILLELSGQVGAIAPMINDSFSALVDLDMLFAKSRLADSMKASVPIISRERVIHLNKARHPLISRDRVVPVDITLGESFDTLVITGPNTGGKTVALKTLGLLTLMAACGMLLPTGSDSRVPVFERVLADIGDEQSIEQSLSTFSSHITNIISILKIADHDSLVLVDELGAGTDPVEGAALAVSIIEALRSQGAMLAATTHYAEIKMYALTTEGVENGSCEFNVETLSPTYRLLVGVPGRSNAFAISQRLGLPLDVIERAKSLVSSESRRFEDVVDALEETRQQLEQEQIAALSHRQQAEYIRASLEQEKKKLQKEMEQELQKAREKAQGIVERVRSQTDQLLNELEELRKQKDKDEFSAKVSSTKSSYKGRIESLRNMADPVIKPHQEKYKLPRKLKGGDTVIISEIGTEGVILSGPDSSGNYMVQAGIMKTKVNEAGLRLCDDKGKKVTFNNQRRVPTKPVSRGEAPGMELDIRGMASDEGIMELDRFIDRAVLSGISIITIIHGKGTGVLRAAVQERLRKHRNVRTFRAGVYGEGEAGVTIAELK
ncbi:MAG: endonuclease MutS2 [Angelakisella sp.]